MQVINLNLLQTQYFYLNSISLHNLEVICNFVYLPCKAFVDPCTANLLSGASGAVAIKGSQVLLLLKHVLVVYADLLMQVQLALRVPQYVLEIGEFIKVIKWRELIVPRSLSAFLLHSHFTLQPVYFIFELLL